MNRRKLTVTVGGLHFCHERNFIILLWHGGKNGKYVVVFVTKLLQYLPDIKFYDD
jgi:hypothetical protein